MVLIGHVSLPFLGKKGNPNQLACLPVERPLMIFSNKLVYELTVKFELQNGNFSILIPQTFTAKKKEFDHFLKFSNACFASRKSSLWYFTAGPRVITLVFTPWSHQIQRPLDGAQGRNSLVELIMSSLDHSSADLAKKLIGLHELRSQEGLTEEFRGLNRRVGQTGPSLGWMNQGVGLHEQRSWAATYSCHKSQGDLLDALNRIGRTEPMSWVVWTKELGGLDQGVGRFEPRSWVACFD